MQRRGLLCVLVLVAAGAALSSQRSFANIPHFRKLNDQVWTSGQPALTELPKLKAAGISTIVSLRQPGEFNSTAEADEAKRLGLRYFHIDVDSSNPQDKNADEFLEVMADPENRPVLIKCRSGNRVGAFWMIRRVIVEGWSIEAAQKEAEQIGLDTSKMREFALDYIRRHAKPAN